MFERFTQAARKSIFHARQEAKLYGNSAIEPEHLLLGILKVDEPLVQGALRTPMALPLLRMQIEGHCRAQGGKPASAEAGDPHMSTACKRVLTYAEDQAQKRHDREIDTRHLLVGIFREESCYAAGCMRDNGITLEALEALEAEAEPAGPSREFRPRRDLTAAASGGQLAPLIGRERELDRLIHILVRRSKNSVFLVGEPGVGKTALVEGLAARIASGTLAVLSSRRLVSVDAAWLEPAVLGRIGDRQETVKASLEAALRQLQRPESHRDTILCIEGLLDMESAVVLTVLEPGRGTSELQCIATGTPAGFRRFAAAFEGLARRFELVELAPATPVEAVAILQGLKERYEKFHGVSFADDAIPAAVSISGRTLPQRYLPDRALDLLDDAGARAKLRGQPTVTAAGIAEAAAERAGMPLGALNRVLELHKPLEFELVARELAARLPADQHAWLPFLAAYLAGCSPAAAEELAQGIREAKAQL
ncbi:MAG: Clp protease N-terminal domain-containing protein [Bryobacteraceae bacterium]